jgi:LytS/YehU family sensor histidine kinase
VPPLSLESLVENSVKHVIAVRPAGGAILVTASADGSEIHLEVRDDGPGFAAERMTPGHGLDNLSARLALLFAPRAGLTFARNNAASPRCALRCRVPRRDRHGHDRANSSRVPGGR